MIDLVERIARLHDQLDAHAVPHAFGGALALAWCTQRARGTIDIDLNVFVPFEQADEVLAVLPEGVEVTDANRADLARDGQTRLWWEGVPVDVFFDTTDFHHGVATRVRSEEFAERQVPFLSCSDLAVFKAFFDRPKDWVDLAEMVAVGSVDLDRTLGVLVRYLAGDDHRIARLRSLADGSEAPGRGGLA